MTAHQTLPSLDAGGQHFPRGTGGKPTLSLRYMTNPFDPMTVAIENERPVVVRVVVWAKTGTAFVAAADFERRCVESADRIATWCTEADVHSQ